MRENGNSKNAFHRRVQKFLSPSRSKKILTSVTQKSEIFSHFKKNLQVMGNRNLSHCKMTKKNFLIVMGANIFFYILQDKP